MHQPTEQTLLERARRFLGRNRAAVGAAALAAVPLAAAAPAQAGYLHKWTYDFTDYSSGSGTSTPNLSLSDTADGSRLTGTAQYSLSDSAIGQIRAGYSGAGAGVVSAGDRADFSWNFQLADTGTDSISSLQWTLVGFYDTVGSPVVAQTLGSGNGFGSFSGSGSLPFTSDLNNLNWFGADLNLIMTTPGAGQYSLGASLTGDGITYAYVPIPEPAGVGMIVMLSGLLALRRRPLGRA